MNQWLEKGAPREEGKWATDQRGQVIRKITLLEPPKKGAITVHDGHANRDSIVRVDAFSLTGASGNVRWGFVPIYLHQVLNEANFSCPPGLEALAPKVEATFVLSVARGDYIELITSKGEVLEGYYTTFENDRIKLGNHKNMDESRARAKTLLTINKYQVDRFGRKSLVRKEVRTWHGEACISPSPPG